MCEFDWMKTENKNGSMCPLDSATLDENSRVPPQAKGSTGEIQAMNFLEQTGRFPFIHVSDVDLEDNVYGNLTLIIQVGQEGAGFFGSFSISEILPQVDLFQYFVEDSGEHGNQILQIKGSISDINLLMMRLYYNSESAQMGYAPFIVKAIDNNNYGECSGAHFCGTDEPCDDSRLGEPHRQSQAAEGKKQIDVIVGTKVRCGHESCKKCNEEEGCGWCPSSCDNVGKCMLGGSSPLFDTCLPSADGSTFPFETCALVPSPIAALAGSIAAVCVLSGVFFYYFRQVNTHVHICVILYIHMHV